MFKGFHIRHDATDGEERGGTSTIRVMFRGLQYLVLDEADRLLGRLSRTKWMNYWLSYPSARVLNGSEKVNNNSRRQLTQVIIQSTPQI